MENGTKLQAILVKQNSIILFKMLALENILKKRDPQLYDEFIAAFNELKDKFSDDFTKLDSAISD
jgi:hypothetical protein